MSTLRTRRYSDYYHFFFFVVARDYIGGDIGRTWNPTNKSPGPIAVS